MYPPIKGTNKGELKKTSEKIEMILPTLSLEKYSMIITIAKVGPTPAPIPWINLSTKNPEIELVSVINKLHIK